MNANTIGNFLSRLFGLNTVKTAPRRECSHGTATTYGDFIALQEDVLRRATSGEPGYQLHRWTEWIDHLDRMEATVRRECSIPTGDVPKETPLSKHATRYLRDLRTYVTCKVEEVRAEFEREQITLLRSMNACFERADSRPRPTTPAMPIAA